MGEMRTMSPEAKLFASGLFMIRGDSFQVLCLMSESLGSLRVSSFVIGEVALGFKGGGAALSRSGDGLTIKVVGHIARGEKSWCFGRGATGSLQDVAIFIEIDETF